MTSIVETRATVGRGDGIFALGPFEAGDILYVGVLDEIRIKNHSHASQIGKTSFGFHSGLSSIFNHSCDPNCGIRINETGGHDIVAIRHISAGDEAVYDYAMRNYQIQHFPCPCSCGTANCRNSITGWKDLPQNRKDAYASFVAPYLIEIDIEQAAAIRLAHAPERHIS